MSPSARTNEPRHERASAKRERHPEVLHLQARLDQRGVRSGVARGAAPVEACAGGRPGRNDAIIAVLDRTAVAITLHGSASYNSPFLHYSSVMLELWPVGYFGSGDTIQKENIAASGGVTYLKAGALKGNLKGHDAWTFVPVDTQLGPLVQLALNISSNIKQPYVIH